MLTDKERSRRDRLERDSDFWQGQGYLGKPLSPRQQQALDALIGGEEARTYKEAAETLGIAEGTLHKHLSIARRKQPELYASMMQKRSQQLEERKECNHERAKARRRAYYHNQKPLSQRVNEMVKALRQL